MKEKLLNIRNNKIVNYLAPVILLGFMCLLFTALSAGRFIQLPNLKIILNQALVIGIVATGGVLIYSAGNMNMAMGGSTALACFVGAKIYLATGSPILMLLACIVSGMIIMGLCTILCQIFKISIVIITLILMTMLTSVMDWMVGSNPLQLPFGEMKDLQSTEITLILGLLFFGVCLFLFNKTKLGRTLKFVGENQTCARQTGINEIKIVSIAFLISGVAVGLGAFAFLVRTTTVSSTACASLNMDVILAIVLAGTPMNGGTKSKIYSGMVGALMVMVLNNGLLMVGVSSIFIQAVRGVLFLLILILSERRPDVLPVKDMV